MKRVSDHNRSEDLKFTRFGRRGLLAPFTTLVLVSIFAVGLAGCMDSANQSPNCFISASPNFGNAPLEVTFTLSADDVDGHIATWSLDVDGDGDPDYSGDGGPPQTLDHFYEFSGEYVPTLSVTDDGSKRAEASVTVSVL
jgi:hypothetical protein